MFPLENFITVIGVFAFAFIYVLIEQKEWITKPAFVLIFLLGYITCLLWFTRDPNNKHLEAQLIEPHNNLTEPPPSKGPAPFFHDMNLIYQGRLPDNYHSRKFIISKIDATVGKAMCAMEYYTGVSYGFNHSSLDPDFSLNLKKDTLTVGKFLLILRDDFGVEPVACHHYLMFRRTKDWAVKNKSRYFAPVPIIPATIPVKQ